MKSIFFILLAYYTWQVGLGFISDGYKYMFTAGFVFIASIAFAVISIVLCILGM